MTLSRAGPRDRPPGRRAARSVRVAALRRLAGHPVGAHGVGARARCWSASAVLVVAALIAVVPAHVRGTHRARRRAPRRVARAQDRRAVTSTGHVDQRDAAADRGALPGRRLDRDAAADGADAVAHVHEAVALVRAAREVEAGAVVGDLEEQRAFVLADGRSSPRRPRPRACPRSAAPRGSRSRPRPRPAAGSGRCPRPRPPWAARRARPRRDSASGRPRSMSSGG